MAVFDGQWVAYWLPELIVWFVTATSLLALPFVTWRQLRKHRRGEPSIRRGVLVYLDDDFVRGVNGTKDMEREELDTRTTEGNGGLALKLMSVSKRESVTRQIRRTFRENSEPIAKIGGMLDVLDQADEIVRVNLTRMEVSSNAALAASLDMAQEELPDAVLLHATGGFVLLRGTFRALSPATDDDTVHLVATFGQSTSPLDGPRVLLTCVRSYLRLIPDDVISGRCLGWVEKWDQQENQLVFHPIALFR